MRHLLIHEKEFLSTFYSQTYFFVMINLFDPLQPGVAFLYPLNLSENLKIL